MSFDHDATGVTMGTKFAPVPIGIYTLAITKAEEKVTKKGLPMVAVECEIDDAGPFLGRKVWHNVTFIPANNPGDGMCLEFLKNIGEPYEGKITVNPENWIGRTFKCKLKVEKDLKGNDRNAIAYLLDEKQASDEVPF